METIKKNVSKNSAFLHISFEKIKLETICEQIYLHILTKCLFYKYVKIFESWVMVVHKGLMRNIKKPLFLPKFDKN